MKLGDLVREPAGFTYIAEMAWSDRASYTSMTQAAAARAGAKITQDHINGFKTNGEPVYLVRTVVVKQGVPRKKRGRPASKS